MTRTLAGIGGPGEPGGWATANGITAAGAPPPRVLMPSPLAVPRALTHEDARDAKALPPTGVNATSARTTVATTVEHLPTFEPNVTSRCYDVPTFGTTTFVVGRSGVRGQSRRRNWVRTLKTRCKTVN